MATGFSFTGTLTVNLEESVTRAQEDYMIARASSIAAGRDSNLAMCLSFLLLTFYTPTSNKTLTYEDKRTQRTSSKYIYLNKKIVCQNTDSPTSPGGIKISANVIMGQSSAKLDGKLVSALVEQKVADSGQFPIPTKSSCHVKIMALASNLSATGVIPSDIVKSELLKGFGPGGVMLTKPEEYYRIGLDNDLHRDQVKDIVKMRFGEAIYKESKDLLHGMED